MTGAGARAVAASWPIERRRGEMHRRADDHRDPETILHPTPILLVDSIDDSVGMTTRDFGGLSASKTIQARETPRIAIAMLDRCVAVQKAKRCASPNSVMRRAGDSGRTENMN